MYQRYFHEILFRYQASLADAEKNKSGNSTDIFIKIMLFDNFHCRICVGSVPLKLFTILQILVLI